MLYTYVNKDQKSLGALGYQMSKEKKINYRDVKISFRNNSGHNPRGIAHCNDTTIQRILLKKLLFF